MKATCESNPRKSRKTPRAHRYVGLRAYLMSPTLTPYFLNQPIKPSLLLPSRVCKCRVISEKANRFVPQERINSPFSLIPCSVPEIIRPFGICAKTFAPYSASKRFHCKQVCLSLSGVKVLTHRATVLITSAKKIKYSSGFNASYACFSFVPFKLIPIPMTSPVCPLFRCTTSQRIPPSFFPSTQRSLGHFTRTRESI